MRRVHSRHLIGIPEGGPLRTLSFQSWPPILAFLGLLSLSACGGSSSSTSITTQPVTVSIANSSCASSTTNPCPIGVGANWQLSATVSGAANQNVTWSISPSGASYGTIGSGTGLYIAPNVVPTPATVTITATSIADTSATASISVTIQATPPIVTVSIANASCAASATNPCSIGVGANWQLSATVSGAANQNVTWSISPSTTGTVGSGTGLYIAPPTVPTPATVTITATSVADTSASASIPVTIAANDPIGMVKSFTQFPGPQSCPASSTGYGSNFGGQGTCFQLAVSCPQVADFSAYLKVNGPGAPVGTVLLGTGTGGSGLYDDPTAGGYQNGSDVVSSLLTSGYNTVQVSFGAPFDSGSTPRGWLTGPGGVRRLACRYATVADWVYNHPTIINSGVSTANSAPMCATGNSGGSAVIAYAVYEYGLDTEFKMIEPTSGPVMSRIDLGCSPANSNPSLNACTGMQQDMSYSTGGSSGGDAAVIDQAYQAAGANTPTPCTDSINGTAPAAGLFASDSILYQGAQAVSLPNLTIKQLFGDSDTSNAVPQGTFWNSYVTPNPALQCLASPVAHDIPSFAAGATQIATDIAAACH
jgi:hypothetical protein